MVLGALAAVANAQVNLDAASPVAVRYAAESRISSSGTVLTDGATTAQTASAALGASLGTNVTGHVRVDLGGGNFTCNPGFAVNASAGAGNVVLAAGGNGTAFAIFAVTPTAGAALIGTNAGTIDTAPASSCGVTVTDHSGVSMRYRLFETLTEAANPSPANTLKDTAFKPYLSFFPGLAVASTATSATADVAATPAYTNFTPTGIKALSTITVTESGALLPSGAPATGADIAASGVVTVWGDFEGVRNADGTYTGFALGRVYLTTGPDCGAAASAAATALSATAATLAAIAGGDLANTHRLCFAPEGATQQIQASTYTGSLDLTANAGFTVFDPALNIGSISRNGINAVAPLVQISPGFTARLALVNRGSVSRDYTVAAVSESGVTLTLSGALAGGTLAANQTRIIEMNNLISAGLRGSLVVTINAPLSQVDVLYQVTQQATGATSNTLLSYK
ncbi:MAG: hypothetical protein LW712_12320 [Burkholderiaceae bacterium]|nr:hypothetical protein [Burkholderiaceae bacterium]